MLAAHSQLLQLHFVTPSGGTKLTITSTTPLVNALKICAGSVNLSLESNCANRMELVPEFCPFKAPMLESSTNKHRNAHRTRNSSLAGTECMRTNPPQSREYAIFSLKLQGISPNFY
jgi:hypothetical protein